MRSRGGGQFLVNYDGDPGAFFTIETSTDLNNWTSVGSQLAINANNVALVSASGSEDKRFWRVRRGQ